MKLLVKSRSQQNLFTDKDKQQQRTWIFEPINDTVRELLLIRTVHTRYKQRAVMRIHRFHYIDLLTRSGFQTMDVEFKRYSVEFSR